MSTYYDNFIRRVIESSDSETWDEAVSEWKIIDCEEDEKHDSVCICGKEDLRYLYTIRNEITGIILSPIGSSCIRKFHRNDLDEEVKIQEGLFKLYHAIEDNERIELTSSFFTRKLLLYLYEEGAFQSNGVDAENDYRFILNMFNKRNKEEITRAQQRKINAIIGFSIKPFLQEKLHYKR